MNREEVMAQFDRWVKYYRDGGGGSWPRDAFEALLDSLEEKKSCEVSLDVEEHYL